MQTFKTFLEESTIDDTYLKVITSVLKDCIPELIEGYNENVVRLPDPKFSTEHPYKFTVNHAYTGELHSQFKGQKNLAIMFSLSLPAKMRSRVDFMTFVTVDFAFRLAYPPRELLLDKAALADFIINKFILFVKGSAFSSPSEWQIVIVNSTVGRSNPSS